MTKEVIEQLAEACHSVWMREKLKAGWTFAEVTDKERKSHACLVPYNRLQECDKESDRVLARNIPEILEAAGYRIVLDNRDRYRVDGFVR